MTIKAPKNGYAFEEKDAYRKHVWSFFNDNLSKDAKILFFPSKEGLEIPIALSHGFKQENLIAVDNSPAVIATSSWRKKYPDVKFYGGMLSNVIERIKKDNILIDAANLDFCNNLSLELLQEFNTFVCSDILNNSCYISLTMMNGRESTIVNLLADMLMCKITQDVYSKNIFVNKRLAVACLSTIDDLRRKSAHIKLFEDFTYKSGKIKMSYGFMHIGTSAYFASVFKQSYNTYIKPVETYIIQKAQEYVDFLEWYASLELREIKDEYAECGIIYFKIMCAIVHDIKKGPFYNAINEAYSYFDMFIFIHDIYLNINISRIVEDSFFDGNKRIRNCICNRVSDAVWKRSITYVQSIGCYNFN
jgi:hypothetical protein